MTLVSPFGTKAKVNCASISEYGVRLTTFEVRFHRFVLAECNTHRDFSRNSASSRAIPVEKIRNNVMEDPALPIYWGANQKGMQAAEELDAATMAQCEEIWLRARREAVDFAVLLEEMGLHKQLTNRLLEPYMWHTAIITATRFDNFFWQRCHKDAQPEMRAAADAMQLAYYTSEPKLVKNGDWHLPFTDETDWLLMRDIMVDPTDEVGLVEGMKHISAARCARVSYLNHNGQRSIQDDLTLYNRLAHGQHWSPFEHVATPCPHIELINELNDSDDMLNDKTIREFGLEVICPKTGNFRFGWEQMRKEYADENRTDFIPNLPELAHVAERMTNLAEILQEEGQTNAV